jgi:GTP-binding protein EngB required for normal cell division
VDREMVKLILSKNMNVKKVFAKMVLKNLRNQKNYGKSSMINPLLSLMEESNHLGKKTVNW